MKKLYYNKIEIWKYTNNENYDVCYYYLFVEYPFA